MAYTLKTTGIAANCIHCFAVDQDGTTIKDFANSSVTSSMTTTGVTTGSKSWKGTSRAYFTTTNGNYPTFGATKPTLNAPTTGDELSVFVAFAEVNEQGYYGILFSNATGTRFVGFGDDNKWRFQYEGSTFLTTTTTVTKPDTNSRSFGLAWKLATSAASYHGLESGSLSAVTSGADVNAAPTITGVPYLGRAGNGAGSDLHAKFHVVAVFQDALTLAEMQSLHDDWFGTLLETPVTYTYARPASDVTKGWSASTGTDHYALLDETSADAADYVYATSSSLTDEINLAPIYQPETGASIEFRYQVAGVTGGATVTASVLQGSTVIKTDTARSANGDYTMTVTSTDYASVTWPWTPKFKLVSG